MLTRDADFKSKKIRINLNTPIKAEQKAESTDVLKTVDEDRKYVIQASIVRYVTSRRSSTGTFTYRCCYLQYHEGTKDDEEPGAYPGSHYADLAAVHSQDTRHQEGMLCVSYLITETLILPPYDL